MPLHRLPEPILVLGATSLVGRYLLPRLAAHRCVAVALSRSPPTGGDDGIRWIAGDLEAPQALALPVAETVFSLCPIWLLPPALPALRAAGMRRLVAFSSTSALTKARSPDPAERATAARLAGAEEAMQAFCEAEGVAWTVLRPTMIYAEGEDGNVSRLARLAERLRVLPLAGRARGLRQPVHAEDLAWAATAAAQAPLAEGRTYALPGGETLSYRAMVDRIFLGLDRTPRTLRLPEPLWRLAFALTRRWLPGASAAMGERMNQDLAFDGGPASRDFGWAPRPFKPVFLQDGAEEAGHAG
jgi:nucleoside-diphosphate-sugar epimerase